MPVLLALALLLVAICLGATGQVLMKTGLRALGTQPSPATVVLSIFRSAYVAGGIACYAVSSVIYLLALSKLALSYAYPMVALSYLLVTILAWRVLDERIPLLRVVGLGVIMLGVIVMAMSYRGEAPRDAIQPPPSVHSELPK
jgi:drug/metabolite transporter (DMT)-like permease